MKKLMVGLMVMAGPVVAHTGEGAHLHPHDGASWMAVAGGLALIALAFGLRPMLRPVLRPVLNKVRR